MVIALDRYNNAYALESGYSQRVIPIQIRDGHSTGRPSQLYVTGFNARKHVVTCSRPKFPLKTRRACCRRGGGAFILTATRNSDNYFSVKSFS